jgi:hypothetical protein
MDTIFATDAERDGETGFARVDVGALGVAQ